MQLIFLLPFIESIIFCHDQNREFWKLVKAFFFSFFPKLQLFDPLQFPKSGEINAEIKTKMGDFPLYRLILEVADSPSQSQ